jgi:uncharacterized membrane protein
MEGTSVKVPRSLRNDVSESDLEAIARAVDEAESRTSAEIVVRIVHNLLPLERPRARARRTFFELGVQRTARRNGVLLFIVMKKRCFEIVTDEGVARVVGPEVWEEVAGRISEGIDRDGFRKGVSRGVAQMGDVLAKVFPRQASDVNELPDRPTVGS